MASMLPMDATVAVKTWTRTRSSVESAIVATRSATIDRMVTWYTAIMMCLLSANFSSTLRVWQESAEAPIMREIFTAQSMNRRSPPLPHSSWVISTSEPSSAISVCSSGVSGSTMAMIVRRMRSTARKSPMTFDMSAMEIRRRRSFLLSKMRHTR
eukprot:scaffold106_cov246-Pinguiococcus_pyrenoidosus.AAC.11